MNRHVFGPRWVAVTFVLVVLGFLVGAYAVAPAFENDPLLPTSPPSTLRDDRGVTAGDTSEPIVVEVGS